MKLVIDTESRTVTEQSGGRERTLPLYSKEAFERLSHHWLRVGWSQKYSYTFTWLGRPVIQLPEDMLRMQEVIHNLTPDVIVETGVAHGGSLVFYASLCKILGRGRVIGIDITIHPENRAAIESHPLAPLIELVEGNSTSAAVVEKVRAEIRPDDKVLVILDSNHSKDHVAAELSAYHGLVTPGSYIVATDGIMKSLSDVPGGKAQWKTDNPCAAVQEFLTSHPGFVLDSPKWVFNESGLSDSITHWPDAWLQKLPPTAAPKEI